MKGLFDTLKKFRSALATYNNQLAQELYQEAIEYMPKRDDNGHLRNNEGVLIYDEECTACQYIKKREIK